MSEARLAAEALAGMYVYDTVVDTIVCLDGTQIIGAYLAGGPDQRGGDVEERPPDHLCAGAGFNSNSQMIFRENTQPMIAGKHILLLMASITTRKDHRQGRRVYPLLRRKPGGISAIFSAMEEMDGIHINSVFSKQDLPDYQAYDYRDCPYCRQG